MTPCRSCNEKTACLAALSRSGEPPGSPGHAITYEHLLVYGCDGCGLVEIEHLDHDCFDYEEVWDQYEWYVLDAAGSAELRKLIASCPSPLVPTCECAMHAGLRAAGDALPRRAWSFGVEAESHVHPVTLSIGGSRPVLRMAPG